jgi:hypothetical protein
VAIACQGGGSHTAFTAGVLKRLLRDEAMARYELVGLSGTSGGAICALLAWYGLADGDPARPGELLDAFWADNAASAPHERLLNSSMTWAGTLQNLVALPAVSPYANPFAPGSSARGWRATWTPWRASSPPTPGCARRHPSPNTAWYWASMPSGAFSTGTSTGTSRSM